MKSFHDTDNVNFLEVLKTTEFFIQRTKPGHLLARDKYNRDKLKDEAYGILNPSRETKDKSKDLQTEGVKTIVSLVVIDIWTNLEVLLRLKVRGHTDTLTEASNLIDELIKRGEIPNENNFQILLVNFIQSKWN